MLNLALGQVYYVVKCVHTVCVYMYVYVLKCKAAITFDRTHSEAYIVYKTFPPTFESPII